MQTPEGSSWYRPRFPLLVPALLLAAFALGSAACKPPPGGEPEPQLAAPAPVGADYEGAWFTVTVPADFTVRPSLESETAEGHDSAFFDAPDRRATFYVCSPQWGRDATDVALDAATEVLLSDETDETGELSIQRLRIAARDGSYERLVEKITSTASLAQWVFGFRWADDRAHEEYLGRYEEFKGSLEQYAD